MDMDNHRKIKNTKQLGVMVEGQGARQQGQGEHEARSGISYRNQNLDIGVNVKQIYGNYVQYIM